MLSSRVDNCTCMNEHMHVVGSGWEHCTCAVLQIVWVQEALLLLLKAFMRPLCEYGNVVIMGAAATHLIAIV